jgi:DNA polymerase I-like protein with 3'-5' exonuclease and polymerase domains
MSKFAYIAKPFIVPATAKSDGLRLVFDAETNGLLDTVTTVHCIVVRDLDRDQVDEYGPGQIDDGLAHLAQADVLIGHNICGYDLPLLRKLHNWTPKAGCIISDTLIASRTILPHITDLDDQAAAMGDPKLGTLRGSYSIEAWGARLGIPKVGADITDWSQWTAEMQARCVGDTAICKALYHFSQPDGYSAQAIELEHRVAPICDRITADSVPFDRAAAEQRHEQWNCKLGEREAKLQTQFPGTNLNSRAQIGALLEARGWVPKKRTEKTKQPCIDDEVLETIPALFPEFAGLAEYDLLRRRIAQLATGKQAWLKQIGEDGRIHGALIHIGTPHGRAKHLAPNLAQTPNAKKGALYAAECRALFRHPDDWVFVCCDQSNLQDRAFAHHLAEFDGGAYAKDFLAGVDKHWQNAIALELIPAGTKRDKENRLHAAVREGAKTFRYGFLFGAGVARCGEILTETVRAVRNIEPSYTAPTDGRQARDRFIAATPGLQQLRNKLEAQVARHGWLPGLDGRRVPCRAQYTALNYTLASIEAIVCKRWLAQVYDELCARFKYGWDGDVVITLWVHDEIACCCRPEIAEQVGEILVRHAKEAGEHFGLKCRLDAEFKIGRSWAGEPPNTEPPAPPAPLVPEPAAMESTVPIEPDSNPPSEPEPDDTLDEPKPDIRADRDELAALLEEADRDGVGDDDHGGVGDDDHGGVGDDDHDGVGDDASDLGDKDLGTADFAIHQAAGLEAAPAGACDIDAAVQNLQAQIQNLRSAPALIEDGGDAGSGQKRSGANGSGGALGKFQCPWHADSTPSLQVYEDHYHCFGCHRHGPLSDLPANLAATTAGSSADEARTLAYAHELWDAAQPIAGTLAERYLAAVRGIDVAALWSDIEKVLRFHPACPFNGGERHPCLIALFRDIETDVPAGIHRIALTPEAQKIERQMLGRWPRDRARAIKLWPAGQHLYLGEGIETVLAAATRLKDRGAPMQPAWAAGSSGNIEKFPIVRGVEELVLLADRGDAGKKAVTACRLTWKAAGRRVRCLRTQDANLNDFNDLIRTKLRVVP